jgi:hypothetical protein
VAYLAVGYLLGSPEGRGIESAAALGGVFALFATVLIYLWSEESVHGVERLAPRIGKDVCLDALERRALADFLGRRPASIADEVEIAVCLHHDKTQILVVTRDRSLFLLHSQPRRRIAVTQI